MTNPIKYYRHVTGPRRKIVQRLWDSEGREHSLLECGHALPAVYKGVKAERVAARYCPLCNKRTLDARKIDAFGYTEAVSIQQAILEGKRRRAVRYFEERGLEVPQKLLRVRFRWALYEDPSKVIPES
jgi:hypothetical protein